MSVRGFIVQPTYRIESGRPVTRLYGRLETGRTFLVRETRETPRFYILATDAERARQSGARVEMEGVRTDFAGRPVARVTVAVPPDVPPLRDRLTAAGIECFEADVRFALRYLIDRGIRGVIDIRGEPRPGRPEEGVDLVFEDPDTGPAVPGPGYVPSLKVLSFDIETDPRARELLSIGLHGCGASEVLLLAPPGTSCPEGAVPFPDAAALIAAFCRRVRELDPDVLTGWNVIDFDLAVLARLADKQRVPLELGRGPGRLRLDPARGFWGTSRASLPGRVVLDGIALLRGAFIRMESYSLDAVSREVLGTGKTVTGGQRAAEILRMFREDRPRFVEYNLTDARLVIDILDRLRLIELTIERSLLTGQPPDRVQASVASFDFLYLTELERRGIVAPTVRAGSLTDRTRRGARGDIEETAGETDGQDEETDAGDERVMMLGGHVMEPVPGLYRNVLTYDFRSLYPSIIRTFQIDPLGYIPPGGAPADHTGHAPNGRTTRDGRDSPIVAPNGAAFRREPGILPGILDELFPRRAQAKAAGDTVRSNAIKILMNSFYGVLGTPTCRFHNPDIANAITAFGRELLLWTKGRVEAAGHKVLYGDTDSLFVLPDVEDPQRAAGIGRELARELNGDLTRHIRETWDVPSRLELEFETLYLRLLLLPLRHGSGGARKRYAGLVLKDGREELVYTGLEVVRRDWTELAKRVQRGLYERLFSDRPVERYLKETVADLRAGRLDDLLVYRKALRKGLEEYTETTPPHVAAARKLRGRPGRLISYVITTAGPEPVPSADSDPTSLLRPAHPPDHEHYLQKQIRPVAEPVLALLGLDFDKVVGDDAQLDLF